jgi:hypothetical protein
LIIKEAWVLFLESRPERKIECPRISRAAKNQTVEIDKSEDTNAIF